MMTSKEIRRDARSAMIGRYPFLISVSALYICICYLLSILVPSYQNAAGFWIGLAVSFIVSLLSELFSFGICNIYLKLVREGKAALSMILSGFRGLSDTIITGSAIKTILYFIAMIPFYVLQFLYYEHNELFKSRFIVIILFASAILICGLGHLYVHLTYEQFFRVCIDNPGLHSKEILSKSHQIMKGSRIALLKLYLSLIGYVVLSILSLGIGLLWVAPYIRMCQTNFYETLKDKEK